MTTLCLAVTHAKAVSCRSAGVRPCRAIAPSLTRLRSTRRVSDLRVSAETGAALPDQPIDKNANEATRTLFKKLRAIGLDEGKILFGQEFPTSYSRVKRRGPDNLYGTGLKDNGDHDQSDVKDIIHDHPAVHGFDFHFFLNKPWEKGVHIKAAQAAHSRGAVITFDWHMLGKYPKEKKNENDADEFTFDALIGDGHNKTRDPNAQLVEEIANNLRGQGAETSREWYFKQLDAMVLLIKDELKFESVPVIFRPFHEMTGHWFWWGLKRVDENGKALSEEQKKVFQENYKKLWRLTVDYLQKNEKKEKNLHNLLYAWSTDKSAKPDFFPGNDFVDVISTDFYEPFEHGTEMVDDLAALAIWAREKNKIAALTETGHRAFPDDKPPKLGYPDVHADFWTKDVLEPILGNKDACQIAWILTWIHSSWSGPFVPYLGMKNEHDKEKCEEAVKDFEKFYEHSATVFEKEWKEIMNTPTSS